MVESEAMRSARLPFLLAIPLALASCGAPADLGSSWRDQLVADSPCYRVNLVDGLSEESTTEVHDLFGCLDHHGHLAPLRPVDAALEQIGRGGRPIGIELASWVNRMPEAGVDPFRFAGVARDLLRAEDRPIEPMLDVAVELIYARPAAEIRAPGFDLNDPSALEAGALAPLSPVVPAVAGALLDDGLHHLTWLGERLEGPEAERWLRTFEAYTRNTHPSVREAVHPLLRDGGEAILATRSPGNDRWSGASGDSLRDLVDAAVLGPNPPIDALSPHLDAMLGDARFRADLERALRVRQRDGHLQPVPAQIAWLARVDVDGRPVAGNEPSALASFIRLLARTNRPMRCEIDLWLGTLEVDLGNLAVTILETVADWSPDDVRTGAGLLGQVLGGGLSQTILDSIADSGACTAIDRDVVHDLRAIDRLYDDEAYDLLVVFLDLLKALKYAERNRIPVTADAATLLHQRGLVGPTEELFVDIGDEPLVTDVIRLIPLVDRPADFGVSVPGGPVTLADFLGQVHWLVRPESGRTGWQRLAPVLTPILEEDGTWEALGNAATVLADPDSEASRAHLLLPDLLATDPELTVLHEIARLLGREDLSRPLLTALAEPAVSRPLLDPTPHGSEPEVPLAWGARLLVAGSAEDLLALIDLILRDLQG